MIIQTKQTQTGVILVISLIILVLLTIIGTTAMQLTSLEEKMAGNDKEKNLAFQAAEAALRDGEQAIEDALAAGTIAANGQGIFPDCRNGGICEGDDKDGVYNAAEIINNPLKFVNAADYGSATGNTALAGLNNQPQYIVVAMKTQIPGAREEASRVYKVISVAQGAQGSTQITLESLYK